MVVPDATASVTPEEEKVVTPEASVPGGEEPKSEYSTWTDEDITKFYADIKPRFERLVGNDPSTLGGAMGDVSARLQAMDDEARQKGWDRYFLGDDQPTPDEMPALNKYREDYNRLVQDYEGYSNELKGLQDEYNAVYAEDNLRAEESQRILDTDYDLEEEEKADYNALYGIATQSDEDIDAQHKGDRRERAKAYARRIAAAKAADAMVQARFEQIDDMSGVDDRELENIASVVPNQADYANPMDFAVAASRYNSALNALNERAQGAAVSKQVMADRNKAIRTSNIDKGAEPAADEKAVADAVSKNAKIYDDYIYKWRGGSLEDIMTLYEDMSAPGAATKYRLTEGQRLASLAALEQCAAQALGIGDAYTTGEYVINNWISEGDATRPFVGGHSQREKREMYFREFPSPGSEYDATRIGRRQPHIVIGRRVGEELEKQWQDTLARYGGDRLAAMEHFNFQRVTNEVMENVDEDWLTAYVLAIANEHHLPVATAEKYFESWLDHEIQNAWVSHVGKIESAGEYIGMKLLCQNWITTAAAALSRWTGGTPKGYVSYYDVANMAIADWEKDSNNWVSTAVGNTGVLIADSLTGGFSLAKAAESGLVKAIGTTMLDRGLLQTATRQTLTRMAASAANFGTYTTQQYLLGQGAAGQDITLGGTASALGQGVLDGAILGGVTTVVGRWADNALWRYGQDWSPKKLAFVVPTVELGKIAVEGSVFVGLDAMKEGKVTAAQVGNAFGMVVAMRGMRAGQFVRDVGERIRMNPRAYGKITPLSETMANELSQAGYTEMARLLSATEYKEIKDLVEGWKQKPAEVLQNEFKRMGDDKNVPWSVYQRAVYIMTGGQTLVMPHTDADLQDNGDGTFTVRTRTADGREIERLSFKDRVSADLAVNTLQQKGLVNTARLAQLTYMGAEGTARELAAYGSAAEKLGGNWTGDMVRDSMAEWRKVDAQVKELESQKRLTEEQKTQLESARQARKILDVVKEAVEGEMKSEAKLNYMPEIKTRIQERYGIDIDKVLEKNLDKAGLTPEESLALGIFNEMLGKVSERRSRGEAVNLDEVFPRQAEQQAAEAEKVEPKVEETPKAEERKVEEPKVEETPEAEETPKVEEPKVEEPEEPVKEEDAEEERAVARNTGQQPAADLDNLPPVTKEDAAAIDSDWGEGFDIENSRIPEAVENSRANAIRYSRGELDSAPYGWEYWKEKLGLSEPPEDGGGGNGGGGGDTLDAIDELRTQRDEADPYEADALQADYENALKGYEDEVMMMTGDELLAELAKTRERGLADAERIVRAEMRRKGVKEGEGAKAERPKAEKPAAQPQATEPRVEKPAEAGEAATESRHSEPGDAEPQPIGRGVFGNVYDQFRGKVKEAVKFLLSRGEGIAKGVLTHPQVGEIDLWYGNDKAGLKKIAVKHPEVLENLQDVINNMHMVQSSDNRIILESDTHRAVVSRDWFGKKTDNWLLSAYDKKDASGGSIDIGPEPDRGKQNGTAPLQDKPSGGKGSENSDTGKGKTEKVGEDDNGPLGISGADVDFWIAHLGGAAGAFNSLMKKAGLKVRLYEGDPGENGYVQNGTVYINRKAKGGDPVSFAMGHELTHRMRQANDKAGKRAFSDYKRAALKYLKKELGSKGLEKEYEAYKERYLKGDETFRGKMKDKAFAESGWRDYIEEEMVCDIAGDMLMSPERARQLLLGSGNITTMRRVKDTIQNWIRDALDRLPSKSVKDPANIKKLRKAWKDTYDALERAYAETVKAVEAEGKKGDKRMSLGGMAREGLSGEARRVLDDEASTEMQRAAARAVLNREERRMSLVGERGARNLDALWEGERMRNRDVAEEMEKAGKDALDIKMATGWERGADNKWRYEIPDGNLMTNDINSTFDFIEKYSATLGLFWNDKQLYDAYPELRRLPIKVINRPLYGSIGGYRNSTHKEESYYGAFKSTLDRYPTLESYLERANDDLAKYKRLQESGQERIYLGDGIYKDIGIVIKGAERHVEDLTKEYNRMEYVVNHPDEISYEEIMLNRAFLNGDKELTRSVIAHEIQHYIQTKEGFARGGSVSADGADVYNRLAGEVEARNVSKRMKMSPEERREILASETEDVPRDQQIVKYDDGESEMGSTTRKRQEEIADLAKDIDLTPAQQAIVDAFSGKKYGQTVEFEDKRGRTRKIKFVKGNDGQRGVDHSVFKHYNTKKGFVTFEEILNLPKVVNNGERLQSGNKVEYVLDNGETSLTFVTRIRGGVEEFVNFYSNRKPKSKELSPKAKKGDLFSESGTNDFDLLGKGITNYPSVQENGAKTTENGGEALNGGEGVRGDASQNETTSADGRRLSLNGDREERKALRESEESRKLFEATKKKFGTTKDINEAGYILPDGTMLDFSGRHWVDEGNDTSHLSGRRSVDHRAIYEVGYDKDENETGFETDMADFVGRGAIRIDSNAGTINLSMAPTKEQARVLRQLIARNDGDVTIDFGDGYNSEHYAEYESARPTRVLGDIDRYFTEGIMPSGSRRYSLNGGTVELNVRTWDEERDDLRGLFRDGGWDEREIDDIFATADGIRDHVEALRNEYEYLDLFSARSANPAQTIVRSNSNYPASFDYSFNCVKKEAANYVVERMVEMGKSSHLGVTQMEAVKRVLQKHGYLTPCLMCYVEAKRQLWKQSRAKAQRWNAMCDALGLGEAMMGEPVNLTTEQESLLKDWSNGKRMDLVEGYQDEKGKGGIQGFFIERQSRLMLENPILRGRMDHTWLMSPSGYTDMYTRFGDTGLMSFLNNGQTVGKGILNETTFSLRSISDQVLTDLFNPRKWLDAGGVRMFSYEDARPVMFFDYYQQMLLLQACHAPLHLYTKREMMPDLFGETGAMINQSLVVDVWRGSEEHRERLGLSPAQYEDWLREHAGFIPSGEGGAMLPNYSGESFPIEKAMSNIRDPRFGGRVGNTVVAPSDAFIEWALDNPDIHTILPYHAQGASAISKRLTGYDLASAYDGGYLTKEGGKKANVSERGMGLEIEDGLLKWNKLLRSHQSKGEGAREAAAAYVNYCVDHGLTPMFHSESRAAKGKKQFWEHENFYKLLADFRSYDENGVSVRQRAVRAELPADWQARLSSYLGEDAQMKERISALGDNPQLRRELEQALKYSSIEGEERAKVEKVLSDIYGKDNVMILGGDEFDAAFDIEAGDGRASVLRDMGGVVYGFTKSGRIWLNNDLFNAHTPLHEHAHICVDVIRQVNPRLYERGMSLWRGTYIWNDISRQFENRGEDATDQRVLSELVSRFTGSENERMISEITGITDKGWLSKAARWLHDMWSGVKSAFGRWGSKDLESLTGEEFALMPFRAFYDPVERARYIEALNKLRSGKDVAADVSADVELDEVTLDTPGKEVMHSVDVTPEMKESVMQGQPLFSLNGGARRWWGEREEALRSEYDALAQQARPLRRARQEGTAYSPNELAAIDRQMRALRGKIDLVNKVNDLLDNAAEESQRTRAAREWAQNGIVDVPTLANDLGEALEAVERAETAAANATDNAAKMRAKADLAKAKAQQDVAMARLEQMTDTPPEMSDFVTDEKPTRPKMPDTVTYTEGHGYDLVPEDGTEESVTLAEAALHGYLGEMNGYYSALAEWEKQMNKYEAKYGEWKDRQRERAQRIAVAQSRLRAIEEGEKWEANTGRTDAAVSQAIATGQGELDSHEVATMLQHMRYEHRRVLEHAAGEDLRILAGVEKRIREALGIGDNSLTRTKEWMQEKAGKESEYRKTLRDLMDMVEGTMDTPDNLKEVVEMIKGYFDDLFTWQENHGLSRGRREDYVTHIWDLEKSQPDEELRAQFGDIANTRTNNPYMSKRVVKSYAEGRERGLVPKYDSILDVMRHYAKRANEAVATARYMDMLKYVKMGVDIDGERVYVPLVIEEGDPTWSQRYDAVRNSALYHNGMPKYFVLHDAKGLVQKEVGKTLGVEEEPGAVARGFDKFTNIVKGSMLKWSFFHHGALTEHYLGNYSTLQGGAVRATWDVMKMLGKMLYTGKFDAAHLDPELTERAASHFVRLGVSGDYQGKEPNDILHILGDWMDKLSGDDVLAKGIGKLVKGASEVNDRLLWDVLHDGFKLMAYAELEKRTMRAAKKNGWDQARINRELDEAGQTVNNMFGGQHFDLLGQSKEAMRWWRRIFLSPDWNVSWPRLIGNVVGMGNLHNYGKGYLRGAHLRGEGVVARKGAGLMYARSAAVVFGIMTALNYMFRKQDEQEQYELAQRIREGYTDENGKVHEAQPDYKSPYERIPGYMSEMPTDWSNTSQVLHYWNQYLLTPWNAFNDPGKGTYLFVGRDDNGRSRYVRFGKQMREWWALLFTREGAFDPYGAISHEVMNKANPMFGVLYTMATGTSLNGWENKALKEANGFLDKSVERAKLAATLLLPMSYNGGDMSDFSWWKMMFPTSKGMSAYGIQKRMEEAMIAGDDDMVARLRNAAAMSGYQWDKIEKSARSAAGRMDEEYKALGKLDTPEDVLAKMGTTGDNAKEKLLERKWRQMMESNEAIMDINAENVADIATGAGNEKETTKRYRMLRTGADFEEDETYSKAVSAIEDSSAKGWRKLNGKFSYAKGEFTPKKENRTKEQQAYVDAHVWEMRARLLLGMYDSWAEYQKDQLTGESMHDSAIMSLIRQRRKAALRDAAKLTAGQDIDWDAARKMYKKK